MSVFRDLRGNRAALFDGIEEGGIRASSSYGSHEIDEHDNEREMEGLQDRVILLKRVSNFFFLTGLQMLIAFILCYKTNNN